MKDSGVSSASNKEAGSFTSLLTAWDELLAAGEVPNSSPLADLPSKLRSELEANLEVLRQLHAIAPPGWVGRFKLIRELGSGGFGTVHLAEDSTLGRLVALKLPHAQSLASPQARLRFLIEARAAAQLQHPHVLPVYEVGEAGHVCYIALAYCPGGSLADWLSRCDTPVPWGDAAVIVAAIAEAVHHAHSRGILHRDLKPANVLLELPSGLPNATLAVHTPRLADFGLAKFVVEREETLTNTGVVVGTPGYIAPEQAEGKNDSSTTTDIYGLGAILYECLTGQPPHKGQTPLATLALSRAGEPSPPSKLRPGLPRDIEAICQKCLERVPSNRYVTALEIAADLRRCLAGDIVQARKLGKVEACTRWIRKRPVTAVLAVTSILFLLSALAAGAWHFHQLGDALRQAERSRSEAIIARRVAQEQLVHTEENFRRARTAVDTMLNAVNEVLVHLPGGSAACRPVLEKAIELYRDLAASSSDDISVKRGAAEARLRLVSLRRMIGQATDAKAELIEARDDLVKLHSENPDNPFVAISLGSAHSSLGHWHFQRREFDAAVEEYQWAERLFEEQMAVRKDDQHLRLVLASCLEFQGLVNLRKGQAEPAEKLFNRTLELRTLTKDDPNALHLRAVSYINLGICLSAQKKPSESEKAYQQAETALESLVKRYPENIPYRLAYGQAAMYRGQHFLRIEDMPTAIPILSRSVKQLGEIANPKGLISHRREYLKCLVAYAETLLKNCELIAADECAKEALQISRQIRAVEPANPTSQNDLLSALSITACTTLGKKDLVASNDLFLEASKIAESLLARSSKDIALRFRLAHLFLEWARLAKEQQNLELAQLRAKRALELIRQLTNEQVSDASFRKKQFETEQFLKDLTPTTKY